MNEKLIVFVTCPRRELAESIAQTVVEDALAACVNVLPGVRSCYRWEEKLVWSDEVLMLIKTTDDRYDALEARIRELHSDAIPEIVAVRIARGYEKYLEWIARIG